MKDFTLSEAQIIRLEKGDKKKITEVCGNAGNVLRKENNGYYAATTTCYLLVCISDVEDEYLAAVQAIKAEGGYTPIISTPTTNNYKIRMGNILRENKRVVVPFAAGFSMRMPDECSMFTYGTPCCKEWFFFSYNDKDELYHEGKAEIEKRKAEKMACEAAKEKTNVQQIVIDEKANEVAGDEVIDIEALMNAVRNLRSKINEKDDEAQKLQSEITSLKAEMKLQEETLESKKQELQMAHKTLAEYDLQKRAIAEKIMATI